MPAEWELRAAVAQVLLSPDQSATLVPRIVALANDMNGSIPNEIAAIIEELKGGY